MSSYLFWTFIVMESLPFSYRLCDILNSEEFDFETFFSTIEAKYFNSIINNLLTFRARHFLGRLLKTRNMETMATGDEHKWTISPTYFTFFLLICVFSPFNVVLEYDEKLSFITAA